MVVYADREVIRNYWCSEKCPFNKSCTLLQMQMLSGVVVVSCLKMWRVLLRAHIEGGTAAVVVLAQPAVDGLDCPLVRGAPWKPALAVARGEGLHFNFMFYTSMLDGISSGFAV